MNSFHPSNPLSGDPNSFPQPSRPQTAQHKSMNPELEFQKNYPKNVFIPLIQYLAQKGYKQAYQECVGTREQIQRKNVVSLDMIFNLTREPWFVRNINKREVLMNISNKILMNSKIKKKLFHLLIGQYILLQDDSQEIKEFKKNISRIANKISAQNLPTDQLFSYSNSIIYLLTMFLKVFRHSLESKSMDKLDEQLQNLRIQQQPSEGKSKPIGSKQEYKYLVKEIVQLFGKRNLSMNELTDAFEQIKSRILWRGNMIRQQYQLIGEIPNWGLFIDNVVTRCFEAKRKDYKITNMILNQWVTQYKNKSICPLITQNQGQNGKQYKFEIGDCRLQSSLPVVKKFKPIILTKNY